MTQIALNFSNATNFDINKKVYLKKVYVFSKISVLQKHLYKDIYCVTFVLDLNDETHMNNNVSRVLCEDRPLLQGLSY